MKSEKLWISSMVRRNEEVEDILKEFAGKTGITGRDLHYLLLLTEETLGMAHHLTKNFEGEIHVEGTPEGYDIILEAEVRPGEGGQPLPAQSPTGFMAKIAEMLNCSYVFENPEEMPDYLTLGLKKKPEFPVWAGVWSLTDYRHQLGERRGEDPGAAMKLDELEKSIVARLADEVIIRITGRQVCLVISKTVVNA